MPNTFEQKYPNAIREASGIFTPFQDDSVLNCKTSVGAVVINLLPPATNYWSTQYKLYVVDFDNNAGVNTITINAPVGCKINGGASLVLNVNGAGAIIRIANNTNYIATTTISGGGGGVTNGANVGTGLGQVFKNLVGTILNFKTIKAGAGITVTNNADDVTLSASATLSYLTARKNLNNPATNYAPVIPAPTFSVVSGTALTAFDSKVEDGVTGFDLATGIWTVPVTGKYAINAKLITRLLATDVNSLVDGGGQGWQSLVNLGYLAIAVIRDTNVSGYPDVLCSNKQVTIINQVSDINIDGTGLVVDLVAGDTVHLNVLNKTERGVMGIADTAGQPLCYADISVIRVHP